LSGTDGRSIRVSKEQVRGWATAFGVIQSEIVNSRDSGSDGERRHGKSSWPGYVDAQSAGLCGTRDTARPPGDLHREPIVMTGHEAVGSGGQEYRTRQLDFGVVKVHSGIEPIRQIGEDRIVQKRSNRYADVSICGRCGTSWFSSWNRAKLNCTADELGAGQSRGNV
jgi:hypothetical protein